ncbi:MAG: TolC family protein [Planctomycetota bacterium]
MPTAPFDPSDGLAEAELVAVALALNPDLAARRAARGLAEAELLAAGLWPDPELGLAVLPGLGEERSTNLEAELAFALRRPGERRARREAARAGTRQVEAEVLAAERLLVGAVRHAHLDVLAASAEVAQLERAVDLRDRALELLRERRRVGEGTELDVSVAELELAAVRTELRAARARSEADLHMLTALLGLPPGFPLVLEAAGRPFDAALYDARAGGSWASGAGPAAHQPLEVVLYDAITAEELDEGLLGGRFELRALEASHARAERELRVAHLARFPRLSCGPALAREEGQKYLGFGVSLVLPILDRGRGEIAARTARRDEARAEYVAALHRLRAEAWAARARLARARAEVDVQRGEVLPLVERDQALYEEAFRTGELSVLDWVVAQERALRSRRGWLAALTAYRRALIDLETALGMPLERSLAPPEGGDQ